MKRKTEKNSNCGEKSTKEVVDQYTDVFDGLGCLKGEYTIEVDENVKPVVTP